MLLEKLALENYCCYESFLDVPMHKLTVFIGENDSGKTTLINAIELLMTARSPKETEYQEISQGERAGSIVITGDFLLEDHDQLPPTYRSENQKKLILKKTYTKAISRSEVYGPVLPDKFKDFENQPAETQKQLLKEINIEPGGNKAERINQINQAVAQGTVEKEFAFREVKFADIIKFLPYFQRISSTDYRQPDSLVRQTFQMCVYDLLYPQDPETNLRVWIPKLQEVKILIEDSLNMATLDIKKFLQNVEPKLKDISVSPEIDFTNSVKATSLMLDDGQGARKIEAFGEGMKKKVWMGLLDWDRKIQEEFNQSSILRLYDEPDANLDYSSERRLFTNILDVTNKPDSNIQSIICTHSVTMIDRASAQSINLIKVDQDGRRSWENLSSEYKDAKDFLCTVGRVAGITNSALFYERAFFIVEGLSEENALPILYQKLYGRSLIEDGIVLVNLHGCGNWKGMLEILGRHRASITIMLLDQDCTYPQSKGKVNNLALQELRYPINFTETNCFYIGSKEFEDSFCDHSIMDMANLHYPRHDEASWDISHMKPLRGSKKFSEDLEKFILKDCKKEYKENAKKTTIAMKLAEACTVAQIPEKIKEAFHAARIRSGCENNNFQEYLILEQNG